MQRYFIHLQNKTYSPKDAAKLLEKARELAGDVIVRDLRVSRKYIELDTSIPDSMYVGSLVELLEKISPIASIEHIIDRHMPKENAIKHAVELFNDEKYWGAHEALEGVWKSTPRGKERDLINGIILVAAAFVHELKDEPEVCLSILDRASKKLAAGGGITGASSVEDGKADGMDTYYGIDVNRLTALVDKIVHTGRIERFKI